MKTDQSYFESEIANTILDICYKTGYTFQEGCLFYMCCQLTKNHDLLHDVYKLLGNLHVAVDEVIK